MSLSADHNNTYGPDAIRRYLKGDMSASDMHAFEKAMHEDPFLEDAVEGMRNREPSLLSRDHAELSQRLAERVDDKVKRMPVSGKWWRYAAAAAVIGFIAYSTWYFNTQNSSEISISKQEKSQQQETLPLSVQSDSAATEEPSTLISAQPNKAEKKQPAPSLSTEQKKTKPGTPPEITTANNSGPTPAAPLQHEVQPKPRANDTGNRAGKENSPNQDAVKTMAARETENKEEWNRSRQANALVRPAPSSSISYFFSGRVTDSLNRPIPFANISTTDNKSLTYTDAQGNYRIMTGDSLVNIQVRSIGYATKNLTLHHRQASPQIVLEKNVKDPDVLPDDGSGKKLRIEKDSSDTDSTNMENLPEAEPADGWGLYHMYLLNNLRMPRDAALNRISGTVTVSFMVNEQGWLYNFRIEKSLCPSCDREAIRLIREGPRWVLYNSDVPLRSSVTVIF